MEFTLQSAAFPFCQGSLPSPLRLLPRKGPEAFSSLSATPSRSTALQIDREFFSSIPATSSQVGLLGTCCLPLYFPVLAAASLAKKRVPPAFLSLPRRHTNSSDPRQRRSKHARPEGGTSLPPWVGLPLLV